MNAFDVLSACEERLRPLEAAANTAWWEANVDVCEETQRLRADTDLALSDALADDAAFAAIRDARAARPEDELVARQLVLLEHAYAPHQVDADLRRRLVELQADVEARFARHRGTIAGQTVDDNTIQQILHTSDDAGLRHEAWDAAKTVGAEVADDVRELARLRNEAARALGRRDHFDLALATSEFDEDRLLATLDHVDRLTIAPFTQWKRELDDALAARFGIARGELRPWHYDDPFFQEPPSAAAVDLDPWLGEADLVELTVRTFDGLGLDVRPVVARSDLTPRDDKSQHAFCIDVDRSGDVRVLSNNVPGERWSETMLHEFGHAIYFDGVDRDLPWLLRTMHLCLTEGVAMLCGRLVRDPRWLRAVAAIDATRVDELAPRLAAARRGSLLVFARWVLVMTSFERGLYADPDGDHDAIWWDLVERYQQLCRPDARHEPDWAAKIHVAAAPVYYHNYLFGEMVASQLAHTIGDLVDRADAGSFLARRVFAPGATRRWDRLIAGATGEPLSSVVLGRDLGS